jgi:hypothetical protein
MTRREDACSSDSPWADREGISIARVRNRGVKGTHAVCDQKISQFFVSCGEESIAGDVGVNGVY